MIDLLIGLAIGLVITAGMLTMWLQLQSAALNALAAIRFHQDLHALSHVMTNDIARAGYWAWTPATGAAISANPFMTPTHTIQIDRASNTEIDNSCITYSYDLNQDGEVGGTMIEQFGFRLHNQAIEMRTGGTGFSCQSGIWQDIMRIPVQACH